MKQSTVCTLSIIQYPPFFGWAGFLSMAIFHLSFRFNKQIDFYQLLGTGRNGTFDKEPNWLQWAIFTVSSLPTPLPDSSKQTAVFPNLTSHWIIRNWVRLFRAKQCTLFLSPIKAHGSWGGFQVATNPFNGPLTPIAVLTRASIRFNKLKQFWENVDAVAIQMGKSPGFLYSIGIGEVPFLRQATFSIWENAEQMKRFAYELPEHKQVIKRTKKEDWYSEEMFVRFSIIAILGDVAIDSRLVNIQAAVEQQA